MTRHLRSPRKRLATKGLKRAVRAGIRGAVTGVVIPKRKRAKKKIATATRGLRRTIKKRKLKKAIKKAPVPSPQVGRAARSQALAMAGKRPDPTSVIRQGEILPRRRKATAKKGLRKAVRRIAKRSRRKRTL